MEPSWSVMGRFAGVLGHLRASWRCLGGVLGRLGAVLRPYWGLLDQRFWGSRGGLGAVWERFGGLLGPSWGVLETSWGVLGTSWRRLGGVLGRLGSVLGRLGSILGRQISPSMVFTSTFHGLGFRFRLWELQKSLIFHWFFNVFLFSWFSI